MNAPAQEVPTSKMQQQAANGENLHTPFYMDNSADNGSTARTAPLSIDEQQHIEVQFNDATTKYYCKIYYAEHFRLLRKLIFPDGEDVFIRSLARSK
jgi:hypothetical protein